MLTGSYCLEEWETMETMSVLCVVLTFIRVECVVVFVIMVEFWVAQ